MYKPNAKKFAGDFYICEEAGNIPVNKNGEVIIGETITLGTKVKRYNKYSEKYDLVCNAKGKTRLIHRIVALTFLECEGDPKDYDVNHIDGNPSNNRLDNLEWVSRRQNNLHAVKIGDNVQSIIIHVENLLTNQKYKFYSIWETARFFNCSGGSVHSYLKYKYNRPFRGHWKIYEEGENEPMFTREQINQFGYHANDKEVIISINLKGGKHMVFPNLNGFNKVFPNDKVDTETSEYKHCYLNDIHLFTENINDIYLNCEHRYDLLKFNRNPPNKLPIPIEVVNKVTKEKKCYKSVDELAKEWNMKSNSLKKSIWRAKGDFKGHYISYIKSSK